MERIKKYFVHQDVWSDTMIYAKRFETIQEIEDYDIGLYGIIETEEGYVLFEIDANDDRFKYWYPGQLINCWNTEQELLEFAKEVFKARFKGDWELFVEYSNGRIEKVIV